MFVVGEEFRRIVERSRVHRSGLSSVVSAVVAGTKDKLSLDEMEELDVLLQWPRGYAEALWCANQNNPTPTVYEREHGVKRPLVHDSTGLPFCAAGTVVWAAPASALIPRILSWHGTALVDVRAFEPIDQLMKLAGDYKQQHGAKRVGQTGVPALPLRAVAVDPLPGIDTLWQARGLLEQIQRVRGERFDCLGGGLTVLAAAILLRSSGTANGKTNGLDLMRRGVDGDLLRELVAESGMSDTYSFPANCENLFRGLYRARDLAVDIAVSPDGDRGGFRVQSVATIKAAQDLTGFLLFYDSDVSPEVPVVVDDALKRVGEPTLVVSVKRPFPASCGTADGDAALVVTVVDSLRDEEKLGRTGGYATVSEFNPKTGRAVYTEAGRARMVEIPARCQLN